MSIFWRNIGRLRAVLAREVELFYAFTKWDLSASILPGCLFAAPALKIRFQESQSITTLFASTISLLAWNIIYIYFFDLSSQIPTKAIEEDRVNKPTRPLCTGQVTLKEARIRWGILCILFLGTTFFNPRLLFPTLIWVMTTVLLSFSPLGKHWAFKNTVAMAAGVWALFTGSWQTILPLTPTVQDQCFYLAAWAGNLSQIQDLRDVEGDAKVHRRTLPIAFGDFGSRVIISFGCVPIGFLCLLKGGITNVIPIYHLVLVHLTLGYRVFRATGRSDRKYDHHTYMMLIYGHSYILAWLSLGNLRAKTQTGNPQSI